MANPMIERIADAIRDGYLALPRLFAKGGAQFIISAKSNYRPHASPPILESFGYVLRVGVAFNNWQGMHVCSLRYYQKYDRDYL